LCLSVFAPYGLLFAAFRANRAAPPAGRQPQRLLWSIWVGHLFAGVAVFLGCRLTSGADYVHGFLLAYPGYAALTGLAFFVMGSTYWSREYAFGLAWLALATLMPSVEPGCSWRRGVAASVGVVEARRFHPLNCWRSGRTARRSESNTRSRVPSAAEFSR
jgi:hypothetical protein